MRNTIRNRTCLSGLIALLLLIIQSGCGPDQPVVVAPGELLKSALPRDLQPNVPDADLAALVSGNNDFCCALYQQIAGGTDNIICSPYSVSLALAMTYAGARGTTATEMAQALQFMLPSERLHPAFNKLDLALMSRGQGAQGREGAGFTLRIANSLWGEKTMPFENAFIDLLGVNYGAGMRVVDFINQPEECRLGINAWVEDQTNDKIKDLLAQGSIDNMTRLVLANAVYFDAMWKDTFEREDTRIQRFCLAGGDSTAVNMMHQVAYMKCAESDSWQALEMPYDGNEMSMVVLLPRTNAGLASLENALTAGMIDTIIGQMADTPVVLSLPKYEFTSGSISLVGPMEALGMHDAFSSIADFSGIDGQQDLSISDIIQKAFVAVDEKGTTAAAATAVTIGTTSIQIPDNPIYFTADHPFLFFIRDIATGQIVFIGKVMKP